MYCRRVDARQRTPRLCSLRPAFFAPPRALRRQGSTTVSSQAGCISRATSLLQQHDSFIVLPSSLISSRALYVAAHTMSSLSWTFSALGPFKQQHGWTLVAMLTTCPLTSFVWGLNG